MITAAPQPRMGDAALQGDHSMTDHPDTPDAVQNHATSLFQYLAALVELRSKMVRDCASYERVFWLGDLPREPECHTPAWSDDDGDGEWLRIEKPIKPTLSDPPEECKPWVDRAALVDPTRQPELDNEVIDPEWTDPHTVSEEDVEAPRLRLEDFPNVADAWETYLESQWLPWREEHKRWEKVQAAYRQLFGIYQQQRRRGEQFELVLGVGTLLWKNDSGHRVRRPVITARVTITLETVSGCISVGPAAEGARFSLEQDMLEVEDRPPVEDQRQYESEIGDLDTLWNQPHVFEMLRSWVNTLPFADAEFSDALSCPEQATKTPKIVFAPVLMLRRRSGQTLQSAIKKVVEQLQDATTVPLGIREVCGDFSHRQNADGTSAGSRHFQLPDELLFPLPTNSEQSEIVHRLNGHPGILVQGPPGTGKSHTIANLICHFLAHGKRVLVTSQTPRALKLLHDKLPARLRSLCVSVLGNDQESLRSLEQSVHGILTEANAWNSGDSEQEIQRITQERRACLSEISHLRQVQRELCEAETIEHFVADSPYHGTPQRIAQQIGADENKYGWFSDDVPEDAECPMSSEELMQLAGLRAKLGPDDIALPNREIPDPQSLPSAVEFEREVTTLSKAQSAVARLGERAAAPRVLSLSQVDEEALRRLADQARECCEIQNALSGCEDAWVQSAVSDILAGNDHAWIGLHNYTRESLDYLGRFPVDTSYTLQTPPRVSEPQLLGDATDLLQHLKSGGGLGFWIFRDPVVKRCQYLWRSYRFNGRLCDSESALRSLVDRLELRSALNRVWKEWSEHCKPSGNFRAHLELLEKCQQLLGSALKMQELAELAGRTLANANCPMRNLRGETWASELRDDIEAARAIQSLVAAQASADQIIAPVLNLRGHSDLHEVVNSLIDAAERMAADDYLSAWASVEQTWETRELARQCLELDEGLRAVAPELATALECDDRREAPVSHLETFEEAWGWKRAVNWLRRYISESDGDLNGRITAVEDRLSHLTEELVALRAWQSCNEHLSQDFQKQGALQAWQQIMRRIGKGKGKHVETYRRDARKYMEQCRDAIPAWIMPLHRVAETVEMKPGAFDIVIVDEASQTGPEGLILQYLGKQCIIVGDDKQISPEAVGVNLNAI